VYPFPDWQRNGEGTFHHLIALFCTVSGNIHHGKGTTTIFCNEIKDLASISHPTASKNRSEAST
jgi:hypothetical protein